MFVNLMCFLICVLKGVSMIPVASNNSEIVSNVPKDLCKLLVIAHRGASGYVPEHTLGAYALAVTMGADYIEPDLVSTSDGHLIARHDNDLSLSTDIAKHTEFAERRRTQTVDGNEMTGWFTEDFTLTELKTLRAIERLPDLRPSNARMDGTFTIPTFQEILDLVKSLQVSEKRTIGIYPEIKHSTHFKQIGLPMERIVVETFKNNGYWRSSDAVYIQSFEVNNLIELKNYTELRLLQLYGDKTAKPFDQANLGKELTYGAMATLNGLQEVAQYAAAVGPDKNYIIPRDEHNRLSNATSFVGDAHSVGLKVHPYTFRAENFFLPAEFQSNDFSPTAIGDCSSEIRAYVATGIDGLFCEHPDIAIRVRGPC